MTFSVIFSFFSLSWFNCLANNSLTQDRHIVQSLGHALHFSVNPFLVHFSVNG